MPKLKPTCQRKTRNSWSPRSKNGGWKGRRTIRTKGFVENMSLSLEWKRAVIDSDSGDEGNDVAF